MKQYFDMSNLNSAELRFNFAYLLVSCCDGKRIWKIKMVIQRLIKRMDTIAEFT